jgi:hypothetical protein
MEVMQVRPNPTVSPEVKKIAEITLESRLIALDLCLVETDFTSKNLAALTDRPFLAGRSVKY